MNFIDLCAGIGGFSLGLEWAGMSCVAQVEIDDYCNRILDRHWPGVPRWRDVKDPALAAELPGADLVCGGYPCQPFSCAGERRGTDDDRHLWPFFATLVAAKRPSWCLFENVTGHITLGLDAVLSDLERLGYAAQALIIPACAVGAPHRRDRVWIVATANADGQRTRKSKCGADQNWTEAVQGRQPQPGAGRHGAAPADADREREPQPEGGQRDERGRPGDGGEAVSDADDGRGPLRGHGQLPAAPAPTGGRGNNGGRAAQHEPGQRRLPESRICRAHDGLPTRLDAPTGHGFWDGDWTRGVPPIVRNVPKREQRLKALGNAVVPQVVYEIGLAILAAERRAA